MVVRILLAEGRHDAAFLGRILMANGYKDCKKKIGDYPKFLKGYLTRFFEGSNIEDSTIKNAVSNLLLPSFSLSSSSKPDEMIITFALGGDSQMDRRIKLVKDFYKIFNNTIFQEETQGHSLRIIYNLDADEHGIDAREQQVNEELRQALSTSFPKMSHNNWTSFGGIQWGLYVFANPATGKGKLEDLVLPLIESAKTDLKTMVDQFIEERPSLNYWNTKHEQYDEEKARISMMCQMEISGSANTVLISKTGLIDNAALQTGLYKELFDYLIS